MTNTKRLQIVVKPSLCNGCGDCVRACAERGRPEGAVPYPALRLVWRSTGATPVLCPQCADAACVRVCPAQANYRTPDQVVRHNEQRCLHCQLCVQACSFGNIDYAEVSLSEAPDSPEKGPRPDRPRSSEPTQGQAAIIKCDLCGYGDASDANACYPRCVQACPSRALLLCRVDPIGDLEVVDA